MRRGVAQAGLVTTTALLALSMASCGRGPEAVVADKEVAAPTAPAPSTTGPVLAGTAAPTPSPAPARSSAAAPRAVVLAAGNPKGKAPVPAEARAEVPAGATRVVGSGTAASCTSAKVVAAVAKGGFISFKCGPKPVTIVLTQTAKVRNTSPTVVIDGGGLVTLSGGGKRRILYQNTCDPKQEWTTTHCDNQETPKLVVQNITFADGNATGQPVESDGGGGGGSGGAIYVRGGQFKVVKSVFIRNKCDATGPDVGGAAIRVLNPWQGKPIYVSGSTFGGAKGLGGVCSNGGALSSIGVSWTVLNSVMSYNSAIGTGANPARPGTPGGGSGGAIYNDGNAMTLKLDGTVIEHNSAKEGGGAIFFVSNDRTGSLRIARSTLRNNPNARFFTPGYPGIFFLGKGKPVVVDSTIG